MLAAPPAMTKVFSIPELLESILILLDMRTLLTIVSRVCKLWSVTIERSRRLQQKLYFCPSGSAVPRSLALNPLLLEVFGEVFDIKHEICRDRRADSFLRLPWAPLHLLQVLAVDRTDDEIAPTRRQNQMVRKGASWRNMLVSQPPPPSIGLLWYDEPDPRARSGRLRTTTIVPSKAYACSPFSYVPGITMGQLYDTVFYFLCQGNDFGQLIKLSWDFIKEPHLTDQCGRVSHRLMQNTTLVMETHRIHLWERWKCGPFTMGAYRHFFQSADFITPNIHDLVEEPPAPVGECGRAGMADAVMFHHGAYTIENAPVPPILN
jgi:hypothetical protein